MKVMRFVKKRLLIVSVLAVTWCLFYRRVSFDKAHGGAAPETRLSHESRGHMDVTDGDGQEDGLVEQMFSDNERTKNEWPYSNPDQTYCEQVVYNISSLPNVSVVITFHPSEKSWRILHTVHSLLLRTPASLLHEIIIVNDNSDKKEHTGDLKRHIHALKHRAAFKLLRSRESLGLIRARLAGTRQATGEVLLVMDSHVEVQEKWLEPLLDAIVKNKRTLAASYLDWISPDMNEGDRYVPAVVCWVCTGAWTYSHGGSNWKTYFDWAFNVGFQGMGIKDKVKHARDSSQPVETPVTIGTIWAIRTDFFRQIGEMDPYMQGWGGENVELPLRVWFCGGRVVNVPCSHAAHSEEQHIRDYRENWKAVILRNYKRVVDVWFGEYAKLFYFNFPGAKDVEAGDLKGRETIRDTCFASYHRDMTWLLRDIYPELGVPDGSESLGWGGLKNVAFNECMEALFQLHPRLNECRDSVLKEHLYWDINGYLRFPVHVLTVSDLLPDHSQLLTQQFISLFGSPHIPRWIHVKNGRIMLYRSNMCLSASSKDRVHLEKCNASDPRQLWSFGVYTQQYSFLTSLARHLTDTPIAQTLISLTKSLSNQDVKKADFFTLLIYKLKRALLDMGFLEQMMKVLRRGPDS